MRVGSHGVRFVCTRVGSGTHGPQIEIGNGQRKRVLRASTAVIVQIIVFWHLWWAMSKLEKCNQGMVGTPVHLDFVK